MIKEIKGNIFESHDKVIVHGCNCFRKMGAGIAKQIKLLYPCAYEVDKKTQKGDKSKLGQIHFCHTQHAYYDQKLYIVNLYSQYYYGRGIQIDYEALHKGMWILEQCFGGMTISMPRIGSGLAGGDRDKIKKIIESIFNRESHCVTIYYL